MEVKLDGVACRIIGYGGSGIVVLRGKTAIKLPKSYLSSGRDDEDDKEVIQREKQIYLRLGNCDGVVPCLDLSGPGIDMMWMENGNVRDYLHNHRVSTRRKMSWLREMARTLGAIHDRRVIVGDISTRNLLVGKDMTIKFCDFTESSLCEVDCDMEKVDDNGYSIYTDIGQFGAVMYEIITGPKCEFDLFRDLPPGPASAVWPRREHLPITRDLWLESVIEKCWTKAAYQNSQELSAALKSATFLTYLLVLESSFDSPVLPLISERSELLLIRSRRLSQKWTRLA